MVAIVQILLVELVNRNSRERLAEVPLWLSEGLVEQLLATSEVELLPPAPRTTVGNMMVTRTVVNKVQTNELAAAHGIFQRHSSLNLDQLSWPTAQQVSGNDAGVFRANAQLFTMQLLRLKNGQGCMRSMIEELASCYNWQTAFLRGYKTHFTSLLDVEKWWMLQATAFSGRDASRLWTMDESRRKLDEMLVMPAEVRQSADEMPGRKELTLQTVVSDWTFARQRKLVQNKAEALGMLRLRLAPEAGLLAAEYQQILASYLEQRTQAEINLTGSKMQAATLKGVIRNTVKNLNQLDERRKVLGQEHAAK
jgi:hypothetical protein